MKLRLTKSEGGWTTIYDLEEDDGDFTNPLIDIPDDKAHEWFTIIENFNKMQRDLTGIWEAQKGDLYGKTETVQEDKGE